ncbi:ribosomal-protein-alanine N-acetyltransferase [Rhizobium sp. NFR07]|uniref:GNAT family N-acetyltransferase n=1 Tax=Rhizobium sp. NFR07 TaxID=1566262 RepID=UPI0008DFB702|nr:GNAT family N-acetyltransferase [Rhizobium sp. NFR07]SFB61111.1 ribosomal-protein-alanine N-acetyltransferase [Rhizobium sp. NFR07]
MTVADHLVVGEVGFAAWKSSDAFKGMLLAPDVIERTREAYESFAPQTQGEVWIADIDGEVVGWAARDGAPNYISDVWIRPDHQGKGKGKGKGIGRALVEHACERIEAEGHATATIHSHARNASAIRLYERCGFSTVWRGIEPSKSMGMDLEKIHLEKPLT